MAHHVEREITTTCRRERAFDFVADFSSTQEWDPGIQAARRLDDRPIGVGSRFELVSRFGSTEQTIVGERDMGDARLNYQEIMYGFFDLTLKGTPSAVMESQPKVRYYTMGNNKWNSSDVWPPRGATPVTYYLASGGGANTLNGDGILTLSKPTNTASPDKFTYDPMDPVPTLGGYRVGSGEPYNGYYYKILTRQGSKAPGGAHNFIVDGKMIGGFALIAWPAEYGNSGITTFLISHDGAVYEKDLGKDTAKIASRTTAFNPDDTWKKAVIDTAQNK